MDSDMDYSSDNDDGEYEDYYNTGLDDSDAEQSDLRKRNPEYFEYTCLSLEEVEKLLNEGVEQLSNILQIIPSLAKVLLHESKWKVEAVVEQYRNNPSGLLALARVKPALAATSGCRTHLCPVCLTNQEVDKFSNLSCGHAFCRDCWSQHFECQIGQGVSTAIGCMAQNCAVRVPEDLVLNLLQRPMLREKYQQYAFKDYVKSHPELRLCPGTNCQLVVRSAAEISPKKVTCSGCRAVFCFVCTNDYHAPTDCHTIQRWLTKCADDSETANYISANTKDCPKCHICIEKNGGCNHMQCFGCKHDFCWMCLGDWKAHGSEYYECSRYKVNPNIANESAHVQAREALKKYLHYYERWENHSKSLQLEEQTLNRLTDRVNEKVNAGLGTWIDWQYLFDAAALLAKCRYTLQYTYPYAYFMDTGSSRKELFEYQQAQLEREIENLSWKIERAETTDRGDLENQMDIAEKRRMTLLKDFFPTDKPTSADS